MEIKEMIDFTSKKRLASLKERTKRCVCKYCGGKLQLRQIVFSTFEDTRIEIFCKNCDRIEYGVEQEIFKNAIFYVEETKFNCYPDLDDNKRTKQMSSAKVCEIMTWITQNMGFLGPDGFIIQPRINDHYAGECLTLTDRDLESNEHKMDVML